MILNWMFGTNMVHDGHVLTRDVGLCRIRAGLFVAVSPCSSASSILSSKALALRFVGDSTSAVRVVDLEHLACKRNLPLYKVQDCTSVSCKAGSVLFGYMLNPGIVVLQVLQVLGSSGSSGFRVTGC